MARAAASRLTTRAGKPFSKLHGSVFGGCIHSQVLAMQGEEAPPPAPHMQKLFDAGHESEAQTKQWLRAQGVRIKDTPDPVAGRVATTDFDKQIEVSKWFDDREGNGVLLALHLDGVMVAS